MREAAGFVTPVAVALLDDETRAFAVAFPPLWHLSTVYALDGDGHEIGRLVIFPD